MDKMPETTEIMLINATQNEEIRVALVKNGNLYDLDIDTFSGDKKKGNIYKAVVTRREPSLDAVFVEYGAKRQGFLPLKEIADEYLAKSAQDNSDEKLPITALIKEGQELLIQVDKEERGNKGAALTTFITLAGCYLVLMPNNPNSGGISRRIEGDERDELKETLNALELPDEMGLIIRTAGVGKNHDELQADLNMLCNQWQSIKNAYNSQLAPCLIHQEGDAILRSIRDSLRMVSSIVIDDHISYIKAKQYIEQVMPSFLPRLKLYNSHIPLFSYYQVESQIETAYQRQVALPSGGALVIDRTEALVSIDVNSAKATSGADIETTAVNTNLEAANEIARQLRLRDLGGLIVIDFIDMNSNKNQREVENCLKEALKTDRARIQVGRISRFGLLEMSRQRLRLSLGEQAQETCPRCEGRGTVRNIQSQSLSIVRLIEEEAFKDKTLEVQVQLPVEMATFVMNEKRDYLLSIEKRHGVHVLIIANPYMHSPQYTITRIKEDQANRGKKPSYALIQQPDPVITRAESNLEQAHQPVVKNFDENAALSKKLTSNHLFKRLWNRVFASNPTSSTNTDTSNMSEGTLRATQEASTNGTSTTQRNQHTSANNLSRNPRRRRPNNHSNNPQRNSTQQRRPSTPSSSVTHGHGATASAHVPSTHHASSNQASQGNHQSPSTPASTTHTSSAHPQQRRAPNPRRNNNNNANSHNTEAVKSHDPEKKRDQASPVTAPTTPTVTTPPVATTPTTTPGHTTPPQTPSEKSSPEKANLAKPSPEKLSSEKQTGEVKTGKASQPAAEPGDKAE